MFAPLIIIIGSVAAQWLLCRFTPSSWWVPDVTWVAVVLVVSGWPRSWLLPVVVAGWLTMSWSVATPVLVFGWCLAGGVALWACGRVMDLTDARLCMIAVGVGELLWLWLLCWWQGASAVPLFGWMALHVALTVSIVPVMRRLMVRWRLAPRGA